MSRDLRQTVRSLERMRAVAVECPVTAQSDVPSWDDMQKQITEVSKLDANTGTSISCVVQGTPVGACARGEARPG